MREGILTDYSQTLARGMKFMRMKVSRRDFAMSLCGLPAFAAARTEGPITGAWDESAAVYKMCLVGETVHWPKPDLDVPEEVRKINEGLADVERKHAA